MDEQFSNLTDAESRAMAELGIDPGFNDYSAGQVLAAYQRGREDVWKVVDKIHSTD